MKIKALVITLLILIGAENASAEGWTHNSDSSGSYMLTASTNYSAPIMPHLIIWCNPSGFDVSFSAHSLVGNGKDAHSLANLILDGDKMKSTWGISTTNNALFIEQIKNRKVSPIEFIITLFKHEKMTITYGAIENGRFTKRSATFSMLGARKQFQSACRP